MKDVSIAEEAMRQSESALYTSTALYIWLREARRWNRVFVITPIVMGAASGLLFFKDPQNVVWASLLAILTGLVPALRMPFASTSTSTKSRVWRASTRGCRTHTGNWPR